MNSNTQLPLILSVLALIISVASLVLIINSPNRNEYENLETRLNNLREEVLYNESQERSHLAGTQEALKTYNSCIEEAVKNLGFCLEGRDEAETKTLCTVYFTEAQQGCENALERGFNQSFG